MNELLPSVHPLHSIQSELTAVMVACTYLVGAPSLRALDPTSVNDDLLIDAKGEVEVYHNGRKLVLRGQPGNGQHFVVKCPNEPTKPGM